MNFVGTRLKEALRRGMADHAVLGAAVFAAAGYVALAIYGGGINYSIVPYLDTYNVLSALLGDGPSLSGWVALHNEHRILATRVLLWIDCFVFHGTNVFLIVMNFVMMFLIACCFFFFLSRAAGRDRRYLPFYLLLSVLPAFSFIQKENIVWEFQSQFFLVSLLPLASCALLLRFVDRWEQGRVGKVSGCLLASTLLAALCVVNMGNGVLFFGVYAVLLRLFGIIGGLGLSGCLGAMLAYQLHSGAGGARLGVIMEAVTTKTGKMLLYVPSALGNFSSQALGQTGAAILGACLLACCAYIVIAAVRAMKEKRQRKNVMALAAGLLVYVCLTVLAAAVARVDLADPFVSRYSTLSLMGFVMCLVGLLSCLESARARRILLVGAALGCLALLAPCQLAVLRDMRPVDKLVAGLCYAYGIDDPEKRGVVHFDPRKPEAAIALMKRDRTGFVVAHPYALSEIPPEAWKTPPGFVRIAGRIDAVKPVGAAGTYVSVTGWALEYKRKKVPPYVYIVDGEQRVVGFAVTGVWRQELVPPLGSEAELAGFAGYLRRSSETMLDNLQFYCPSDAL